MEPETLTIASKISGEMFREFALYDTLRRQKRWQRPALFALFFLALALLALSRADTTKGAALLGGVLLAVGLGLPIAYFAGFFLSVRKRARQIDPREIAYTITMNEDGVTVQKGQQHAVYKWEQLHGACRLEHSVCIYVDALHALLLGDPKNEAAWNMLVSHLPPQLLKDHRR